MIKNLKMRSKLRWHMTPKRINIYAIIFFLLHITIQHIMIILSYNVKLDMIDSLLNPGVPQMPNFFTFLHNVFVFPFVTIFKHVPIDNNLEWIPFILNSMLWTVLFHMSLNRFYKKHGARKD